MEQVQACTR